MREFLQRVTPEINVPPIVSGRLADAATCFFCGSNSSGPDSKSLARTFNRETLE